MKKTIIDQIEIKPDGMVQVRLALQVVEDGEVIASSWHRTIIPPGVDPDKQMGSVNLDLESMKRAPVVESCMARLRTHCAAAHTPEVVAAYRERLAAVLEVVNAINEPVK